MTHASDEQALRPGIGSALRDLAARVHATRFPLRTPDGVRGHELVRSIGDQLDDYLLPRLAHADAPLLVVVGGSTGAGKSTLVNSMIGAEVSAASALRPTTRWPVLVHNPADSAHFGDPARVLPGLRRVARSEQRGDDPQLRLVSSEAVPPGLALIDSPDIDSVEADNRALARQLLAAADLWLFVTTAARYADAMPWELLADCSERGTAVAIVLDRVPAAANREVRHHLGELLAAQGLESAPIFTVPELNLRDGMIPDAAIFPLQSWVLNLGRSERARERVMARTLAGALRAVPPRIEALADCAAEQEAAHDGLSRSVDVAFAHAADELARALVGGRALRGEVLARWQDFVGAGQFFRGLEPTVARLRDRITSAVTGRRDTAEPLENAIAGAVSVLVREQAVEAVAATSRQWQDSPAGAAIVQANPEMTRLPADFDARLRALVGEWIDDVNKLVGEVGQSKRARARILSFGVNGVAAVLMIGVFCGIGGDRGPQQRTSTALVADKLLVTIFGEDVTRDLAITARRSLLTDAGALLRACRAPYDHALAVSEVPARQAGALRGAAARLEELL
ncbi:dynamin family protein [Brevibacterium rongguiense]|uniref:dynamin family protein n=1 Tax=Brevibacterium rongguiense TaxID=2695267 RepID=UPI002E282EC6|nr:dynamin family protein [Brevibacterium rongguiense]